jgi:hypothetical protein
MKKTLTIGLLSVGILFAGCATTGNSTITPTFIGSASTLLVQGAELALQKQPTTLAEFISASQATGSLLVSLANGGIPISQEYIATQLTNLLLAKGVSATTTTSIVKIFMAEYTEVLSLFNITTLTVPEPTQWASLNPYLIAIGTALENAGPTALKAGIHLRN